MDWLISANSTKYDHEAAFSELPYIDWKQCANFDIGDRVYICCARSPSGINFITEVQRINIPTIQVLEDKRFWRDAHSYENGRRANRFVRLKLMLTLPSELLALRELRLAGLYCPPQSPTRFIDPAGNIRPWAQLIYSEVSNHLKRLSIDASEDEFLSLIDAAPLLEKANYPETPKKKESLQRIAPQNIYPRDPNIAARALNLANYRCEINSNHALFTKRSNGKPYTESRHLIPLCCHEQFDASLDTKPNIVSLCCNCHKEIHHGKDAAKLITKLFEEREKSLKKVGIDVSIKELLEMYNICT